MISIKQWKDVSVGRVVRRNTDGALLTVVGKYWGRDGRIHFACKPETASENSLISADELDLI